MTLVNAETGEVVAALSPEDARALTESIKGSAQRLYQLVLEAHEGQAHKALGYATWELYCRTEFDMGRSHAYRLIDQGRIVRALEEAAGGGMSPAGDIEERSLRDIKPHLTEVTDSISKRVEVEVDERADENEQAEKRLRIVAEEVTKAREKPKRPEPAAVGEWLDEHPDQKRIALRNSVLKMKSVAATVVADIDPIAAARLVEPDSRNYEAASVAALVDWLSNYLAALDTPISIVKEKA